MRRRFAIEAGSVHLDMRAKRDATSRLCKILATVCSRFSANNPAALWREAFPSFVPPKQKPSMHGP
jgi:hypothetical protein